MENAKPRILLVDDELSVVRLLEYELAREGYDVVSAMDGKVAWELALGRPPDLVVTDYYMPVMDGLEFCRRLGAHSKTRHIPVLVISSRWCGVEDQFKQLDNVLDLIRKPFSLRDLTGRIAEALARRDNHPARARAPTVAGETGTKPVR